MQRVGCLGGNARTEVFCDGSAHREHRGLQLSAEPQRVDIGAVIADGRSFNGRQVALRGCLDAHHHGLILVSCPSGSQKLVVFTDALKASQQSLLYSEALKSKIQHHRPLAATLCGTYRQTSDGRARWLEVDTFAIDGGRTSSSECRR